MHTHKCGVGMWTKDGKYGIHFDTEKGCGYEWQHDSTFSGVGQGALLPAM